MEYATVSEARNADGLRLVVSAGAPGPWGEAIKAVLACKDLDVMIAGQEVGGENPELVAWTGQASAPVLAWNDDPPRIGCLEQVLLIEAVAPEPALLPGDVGERAFVLGMLTEIAGHYGLGWQRRLQITDAVMAGGDPPAVMQTLAQRYGYSAEAAAASGVAIQTRLDWFASRLDEQGARGSSYLLGETLTVADLYLANFIGLFDPLPHELNPMPAAMRASYSLPGANVPEQLLQHRDAIYRDHIKTPLSF